MNIRLIFLFVCCGLFLAILLTRIFYLSIIHNQYYQEVAIKNITKEEVVPPIRGQIFDRNKEILATNTLGFSIMLPPNLTNKTKTNILEEKLKFIMEFFPQSDYQTLLSSYKRQDTPYNHDNITLIEFIPYDFIHKIYPILAFDELIKIYPSTKRFYPNETSASHVIGYTGRANSQDIQENPISKYTGITGKEGIERQYNNFLQGDLGLRVSKVTALYQEVELMEYKNPIENKDITITLDIKVQQAMDRIFQNHNGAGIVMDAQNGEILAAGSYPEYNLNYFIGGISQQNWGNLRNNPYKPLINKFINGLYPPGSVIKMGVGLGILEYAGVNENTVIQTPPYIELGSRKFRDWKKEGHGSADFYKAIKRSVDVYFYKLTQQTNYQNITDVLDQMGFGKPTGVDLPNESKGINPGPKWKEERFKGKEKWYAGDSANSSIGQGNFLATPLQVANYTALIATGKLPRPHFAKIFQEENNNLQSQDVLDSFQLSKLPAIRKGMFQVCSEAGGTAFYATRASRVQLACKTGTAQVSGIPQSDMVRIKEKDMDYFLRSHAWITAFMPYDNPRYVITIMLEHGSSGSSAAGPILAQLANVLVDLKYIEPTKNPPKNNPIATPIVNEDSNE